MDSSPASHAADGPLSSTSRRTTCRACRRASAGQFKHRCLKMLDDVAATREAVVITKGGRPVAKLVPIASPKPQKSLKRSVLAERGDPFSTGET